MTKDEMVAAVAERTGNSKSQTRETIDALGDLINVEVRSGREIALPGVGKFYRKHRDARTGRNPHTGEKIQVAAKRVPAFKAAKALVDAVA